MSKNLILLLLILFFVGVDVQNAEAKNTLRGTLLKSTLKPLPYTEIELVPVNSRTSINHGRRTATSNQSGKFSFTDIPEGEYTLSINFGEKPTELSPYTTFFFPATENRKEAKIFQVTENSLIEGVVFRLPLPLIPQKVTGKIISSFGNTMSDVYVSLRDLKFDDKAFAFNIKTDKNGAFSLNGFKGRDYEVVAILLENLIKTHEPTKVVGRGKSDKFTLGDKTLNLVVKVKLIDEEKRINDKNIGKLF